MSTPFDRQRDASTANLLARASAAWRAQRFEVEVKRPDGSFARYTRTGGDACGHVVDAIDCNGSRISVRPVAEGAPV